MDNSGRSFSHVNAEDNQVLIASAGTRVIEKKVNSISFIYKCIISQFVVMFRVPIVIFRIVSPQI